jgi:hypothetical protein
MKNLAVLAVVAGLGGCAAVQDVEFAVTAKIPQNQIATAVQGFDALEVSATQYIKLPTCAAGVSIATGCKAPGSASKVVSDVRAGIAARNALWASSKASSDGSVPATSLVYTTFTGYVTAINSDIGK